MREFYRSTTRVLAGIIARYRFPASVRPPFRIVLKFTIQQQVMDQWCWAAVASSVSQFYMGSHAIHQKSIVAAHYGLDNDMPTDETWNRSAPMLAGLQFVGCNSAYKSSSVSFRTVVRALNGRDPVCVQIRWKDVEGFDTEERHGVVITSCWVDEHDRPFYTVGDPGEGDTELWSHSQLCSSYMAEDEWPGGRWEATYFVRHP